MKKFIFISGSLLLTLAVVFIFSAKISADEYAPEDFSADYRSFEVSIGYDQKEGRYQTLHYEFND